MSGENCKEIVEGAGYKLKHIMTPDELNKSLLGLHDASAGEKCFIAYTALYQQYEALRGALEKCDRQGLDIKIHSHDLSHNPCTIDCIYHMKNLGRNICDIARKALRGDL